MTDKIKPSFFQAAVVSILLYGCTTWTLHKRREKKLDSKYIRMLRAILNKSWRYFHTRWNLSETSWQVHLPRKQCHINRDTRLAKAWTAAERVIFTNPSARAGYDTRSIFKRSLTGLKSEFSFSLTSCLTKAEEPNLSYLPIAGGRIIGFIPFPRVLVLWEMQSVSSRIWTRIVASNSYDDNHYTTGQLLIGYRLYESQTWPIK